MKKNLTGIVLFLVVLTGVLNSSYAQSLNGVYTIGGTSPNYTTWNAAVNDLRYKGISGPVTFNVRNGIYNEGLVIPQIPGASSINTVTFQSESGDSSQVILTKQGSYYGTYTISLAGADYLTFKNLTIQGTGTSYATVIVLGEGSNHNTFHNNQLIGPATNYDNHYVSLIYSRITSGDSLAGNTIKNNLFVKASYGIFFVGSNNSGLEIDNNIFKDQRAVGILVTGANSPKFRNNIFTGNYTIGIKINKVYNNLEISGNYMLANGTGIYFENCYGTETERGLTFNNFIRTSIYSKNSSHQDIYHNNTGSGCYVEYSNELRFNNNVFSSQSGGFAFSSRSSSFYSNYNSFFSNGRNLAYYDGNISDLTSWQAATGQDSNSVQADPLFTSETDLHVREIDLYKSVPAITGITEDIDKEPRASDFVCIGADEFTPIPLDASLPGVLSPSKPFLSGTYPIGAVIKNSGGDTLTSLTINWKINGLVQPSFQWSGNVAVGDTAHVQVATYDFLEGQYYHLEFEISSPNSGVDGDLTNNHASEDLAPALGGTYLIGGVSPDFTSLSEVGKVLSIGGVYSPVTFKIRPGTYRGQIEIPQFPGSSCDMPVIFESENGDSTSVILADSSSSYAVIQLNGADGLIFRKLTIEALNATSSGVLGIGNESNCNRFERNIFRSPKGSSGSVIGSSYGVNTNNVWESNLIEGGGWGIMMGGNYNGATNWIGLEIVNNRLTGQYYGGILVNYHNAPLIKGNTVIAIPDIADPYGYTGIQLSDLHNNTQVINNTIQARNGRGFFLLSLMGTPEKKALVANNFISIGGTQSSVEGIWSNGGTELDICHNNVNVYEGDNSSRCIDSYHNLSSNVFIRNNIFSNRAGGYAIYNNYYGGLKNDYNNLFTTGSILGYTPEVGDVADLSSWQNALNCDSNSVSISPGYLSDFDLHVNKKDLDAAGVQIAGVGTDIDGELRSNPPDIGADEFTPTGANAAFVALITPQAPFAAGEYPIYAVVKNSGIDNLTSFSIELNVNNISAEKITWKGNLDHGQVDTISLGSADFTVSTTYDVIAWIDSVNGSSDTDPVDDTTRVDNLHPQLSGTYTIGGDSSDYNSFKDAVNDLTLAGIGDTVTFKVRPGTYTEQVTLTKFPGSNCDNKVIFESENGDSSSVILSHNSDYNFNYVVQLNGAEGVHFRNLTFESLNSYYHTVLDIRNGSHCNVIENNLLRAPVSTNSYNSSAAIYSPSTIDTNNVITGNHIEGGSIGISFAGDYSTREAGLNILNNTISGQYREGVLLQYQNSPTITGNTIISSSILSTYSAVHIVSCQYNIQIRNNRIRCRTEGIYMRSCGTAGYPGMVANNFISIGGTGNVTGLFSEYVNGLTIAHNNIQVYQGYSISRCYYNNGSNDVVRNNIFSNKAGGYAIYNSNSSLNSNYNDLYTYGTNLAYYNGNRTNLSAWQSAGSWDQNSISADPLFVSILDLHVGQAQLSSAGTQITTVTTDIDGEPRGSFPDIGADEFLLNNAVFAELLTPALPFVAGTYPIHAVIKNTGAEDLTSLKFHWIVNETVQPELNWQGIISTGQSDTILLGSVEFTENIRYDFIAWIDSINGSYDDHPMDDTIQVNSIYSGLPAGVYTIGPVLATFENFTQAADVLHSGGVLGSVTFKVQPGTYSEKLKLNQIPGAGCDNKIIFESQNGDSTSVILRSYSYTNESNYVVQLDGADGICFRKLTFQAVNISYSRVLDIRNGSDCNLFENNVFVGLASIFTTDNNAVIYSPSTNDNYNIWRGNTIVGGSYGFFLDASIASNRVELGLEISDNTIKNQYYRGISLRYQNSALIKNNIINSTSNASIGYVGLSADNCSGNMQIIGNRIQADIGGGVVLNSNQGYSFRNSLIANNFIVVKGSEINHGIKIINSDYQYVYFNNVHCTNTNLSSSAMSIDGNGNGIRLNNNIFANSGGGYTAYVNSLSAIEQSNHNNLYSTGSILGYWGKDVENLADWKIASNQDTNSLSLDPLFVDGNNLHVRHPLLNEAGTPISGIETDIDGETRNPSTPDIGADEFLTFSNDIALTSLISPQTSCGMDSATTVIAELINYGALSQTGFDLVFIHNGDTVKENVGALTVLPGQKAEYIFKGKANVSALGAHTFNLYSILSSDEQLSNDTLKNIVITNYKQLDSPVSNMLPADGSVNLSPPVAFSWTPVEFAGQYDLYVWNETEIKPGNPTVAGITQIHYNYTQSLTYGASYKWQVVARNTCSQIAGVEQTFTLRELPDNIVSDVQVPASAYSGQSFDGSWQVKNIGSGTTSDEWIDAVYLSDNQNLEYSLDAYLGGVANFSSLNPNQEYSQTGSFILPEGISGDYYLIVVTDRYSQMLEGDESNNVTNSATPIRITLTPPPNLEVESIVKPNNLFSGQTAELSWTVKNTGSGDTRGSVWYDQAYLSADSLFSAAAISLGRFKHTGSLASDSGYTQTATITIPHEVFGNYYFIVRTDAKDQIYEHALDMDNTTISSPVNIILLPPPDHVVTNISGPASASNKENVIVEWTVENQGGTSTTASGWVDAVYISDTLDLTLATARSLGTISRSTKIAPGEAYHTTKEISIPSDFLEGDYYIFVKTDIGNKVYEYELEGNNVSVNDSTLKVLNPDLVVSAVESDNSGFSGKQVELQWRVKNTGNGQVYSTNWKDYIYGSSFGSFHADSVVMLDSLIYTSSVPTGDSIAKNKLVKLPNGISGTYYLYLDTDVNNKVFEGENEGNNSNRSNPVTVTLSPWADLQVKSIQLEDTLRAGDFVSLEYIVTNMGQAITELSSWKDKIFLSQNAVWRDSDILLRTIDRSLPLSVDSSYEVKVSFQIPPTISSTRYYLFVFTDGENVVYEHTDENNNVNPAQAVFIKPYPPIDLAVTNAVFTGEPASGKQVSVSWMVQNIGEGTTIAAKWNDAVYISTDAKWDVEDILLSKFTQERVVKAGESYQENKKVTIPNGVSGLLYLLAVTDLEYANPDVALFNNYLAAADTSGGGSGTGGGAIDISLTPPADLVVTTFAAPPQAISGQPISLSWTVSNNGSGPTIQSSWTDKVFLSTDNTIDGNDYLLGSFVASGKLAVGASYTTAKDFTVPVSYSGNYILIVMTDYNNGEYEHSGEDNITKAGSISLEKPAASDLIVSEVSVPENAVAGAQVSLLWKTKNTGSNPSSGKMKEAVFLSSDTTWDIKDVLIGTFDVYINLAPQAELIRNISADLPAVPLGDYYLLVQTDILNNIYELSDSNNTRLSEEMLQVTVPELAINVVTPAELVNKKSKYYKIIVPAELAGESLLITLEGDSTNGNNELYLRHGDVPTRVLYDYAHELPFQGNQEIVIPELTEGIYYVLVHGNTTAGTSQKINLFAKILNFEIRSVNADKGGNSGSVTVQLKGSKFDPAMVVSLIQAEDTVIADSVIYINPTRVFATFNLIGTNLGKYDVAARNGKGEETSLSQGFEVVQGGSENLVSNIINPPSTRPSNIVAITIEFSNKGTTDIINPQILFTSGGGAPVAFTVEELEEGKTELVLPLNEQDAPAGILRPGANGSITVYSKAIDGMAFIIRSHVKK